MSDVQRGRPCANLCAALGLADHRPDCAAQQQPQDQPQTLRPQKLKCEYWSSALNTQVCVGADCLGALKRYGFLAHCMLNGFVEDLRSPYTQYRLGWCDYGTMRRACRSACSIGRLAESPDHVSGSCKVSGSADLDMPCS
jgi:hypothetical protein